MWARQSARGDTPPRSTTLTLSPAAGDLTYLGLCLYPYPGLRPDRCPVLAVVIRRAASVVQTAPSDPVDCGPVTPGRWCPVGLESVGVAEFLGLR
jgi:hypothetical protein